MCRICVVQIQPRNQALLVDRTGTGYAAPTLQHEPDHTHHTHHTDHTDQEYIYIYNMS